jgi:hypothetical protein
MKREQIKKIWIDESTRLCIQPLNSSFEMVYRSAMGVYWNASKQYLYLLSVGSLSLFDWYQQIITAVAQEYGCRLFITDSTQWENIDETLKLSIIAEESHA